MKNLIAFITLLVAIALVGCSHCSKTVSKFDGRTSGLNPYGEGDLEVDRTSYWGTQECIKLLFGQEIEIDDEEEMIEIDLSDLPQHYFADYHELFYGAGAAQPASGGNFQLYNS